MIKIIKTHNVLNGLVFSIVEFALVAVALAPFAVYYIFRGETAFALVSLGIILNCAPIVLIGLKQMSRHEAQIGLRKFYSMSKEERDKIGREHPDLMRQTMLIVVTVLIPYLLVLIVLVEWLMARGTRRPA